MTKKEKVFAKFDGKCAYTGKILESDWQIDHIISKHSFKQILLFDYHYRHRESGEIKTVDEMNEMWLNDRSIYKNYEYFPKRTKPHPDCNKIENLFPALRIVNHYKRSHNLEYFRYYMQTFHTRLAKQPKNPTVKKSIARKAYMWQIADAFGITLEKPFDGIFYFEKIKG